MAFTGRLSSLEYQVHDGESFVLHGAVYKYNCQAVSRSVLHTQHIVRISAVTAFTMPLAPFLHVC
jgi:hypothetical protein